MSKTNKKNPYTLKFQISKGNLQCFMKKKSMSVMQNDKITQKHKTSRGKPKSVVKKLDVIHQQKFISSIIKNVMDQEFSDPKQVTEMLNTMNLQNNQENHQSPTNEDDILKNIQIFKQPSQRFKEEKMFKITLPQRNYEIPLQKQFGKKDQHDMSFGKQFHFKNYSTQRGTDAETDRSKRSDPMELYPSLLPNQYYPPMTTEIPYEGDQQFLTDLSKQQRQRKSTPIRGQNEKFRINLDRVQHDGRTTVMIRHIPNKYTQQMLIDEVNENHRYKYNFFYLPVDSYNPCNVGYAFVNFIDAKFIAKFYQEFNGKRWNKFNSQKICELAYARIQGSTALINHFQNSNIMRAGDKRLRPFISFGEGGQQ